MRKTVYRLAPDSVAAKSNIGIQRAASDKPIDQREKETNKPVEQDKPRSKSAADANIDFDQILESIFPDEDAMSAEKSKGTKHKKRSNKKERYDKSLIPSLKLELAPNDKTLQELIEMDWSNFEDIELEKTKIE